MPGKEGWVRQSIRGMYEKFVSSRYGHDIIHYRRLTEELRDSKMTPEDREALLEVKRNLEIKIGIRREQ